MNFTKEKMLTRKGRIKVAATEAKVKVNLTIEVDEESLREMFENYEIKFTKKKVKELNQDINDNEDVWFAEVEEAFLEILGNWLGDLFDE